MSFDFSSQFPSSLTTEEKDAVLLIHEAITQIREPDDTGFLNICQKFSFTTTNLDNIGQRRFLKLMVHRTCRINCFIL